MAVLWQQCAGKKWCVHIPFDGEKCLEASACVRVIEENANYFFEVEIAGQRARMNLGNSYVEARWYVFAAKICAANVQADNHSISFDIILRLCIDANLGPIHIGECVDILRQRVRIAMLTVAELAALGLSHPMAGIPSRKNDKAYAYVELAIPERELKEVEKMFDQK